MFINDYFCNYNISWIKYRIMDILNNPWVTGIGGGIISSLIVFFVTKYLFSKH